MNHLGLSTSAAKQKIKQWGYNEITASHSGTILDEIKKVFLDPMGVMLLSLSGLYWILGDKNNSIILFIAFFPVTAVDVILGIQSGKALKALRGTLTLNAKLIRDGSIQEVPIRAIVPDDVMIFEEGQTLPADGIILEAENLSVTEAALTGESIPVTKNLNDPFFGGTTILTGRGTGLIQRTGKNSQFGSIAKLMDRSAETKSPLRKTVDQLVKVVFGVALCLVVVLFFIEWAATHQLIQSLIVALTLGMAAVPEEFPLVFTLYLSLGAWRLSKNKILVKSLPSVEALGGVDVICTDKTGTLTEGVFRLEELDRIDSSILDTNISQTDAWLYALMACEPIAIDSMEIPIFEKAHSYRNEMENWNLTQDFPFDVKSKTMMHVWTHKTSGKTITAMKGAAEGVLSKCLISPTQKADVLTKLNHLASQGKRILGLAAETISGSGLKFIGFLVYSDPIRTSTKQAILGCQDAGIQIKMLTGDHLLTAHSIADQIGLAHAHEYLFTGDQIEKMSAPEKIAAYLKGSVFARVTPEQKFEMVKALQTEGKIVAMTGDGINDAPALQLADIGISMGKSATDVARSAAKMVLLDNNFTGIVTAIFEGRKIFANLQRSFSYLISFHIPVILLALIPPFFGWPPILMPIHIILLELVVHPVSAFTFENIIAKNPAKNTRGFLLTTAQMIRSCSLGILLSLLILIIFWRLKMESPEFARLVAFSSILIGNILFVLVNALPNLNRRFYITAVVLFLVTVVLAMNQTLGAFLYFRI